MEPRIAEPLGEVVTPNEPPGGLEPTEGLAPNLAHWHPLPRTASGCPEEPYPWESGAMKSSTGYSPELRERAGR